MGLASHWPCVTDFRGLSTNGLTAEGRVISTPPRHLTFIRTNSNKGTAKGHFDRYTSLTSTLVVNKLRNDCCRDLEIFQVHIPLTEDFPFLGGPGPLESSFPIMWQPT